MEMESSSMGVCVSNRIFRTEFPDFLFFFLENINMRFFFLRSTRENSTIIRERTRRWGLVLVGD